MNEDVKIIKYMAKTVKLPKHYNELPTLGNLPPDAIVHVPSLAFLFNQETEGVYVAPGYRLTPEDLNPEDYDIRKHAVMRVFGVIGGVSCDGFVADLRTLPRSAVDYEPDYDTPRATIFAALMIIGGKEKVVHGEETIDGKGFADAVTALRKAVETLKDEEDEPEEEKPSPWTQPYLWSKRTLTGLLLPHEPPPPRQDAETSQAAE